MTFRAATAYTNGNTASALVPLVVPAASQVGDVAIACISSADYSASSATITAPSGWTLLTNRTDANGAGTQYVFGKTLVAGDPGKTMNFQLALSNSSHGVMIVESGVALTGHTKAHTNIASGGSATAPAPPKQVGKTQVINFWGVSDRYVLLELTYSNATQPIAGTRAGMGNLMLHASRQTVETPANSYTATVGSHGRNSPWNIATVMLPIVDQAPILQGQLAARPAVTPPGAGVLQIGSVTLEVPGPPAAQTRVLGAGTLRTPPTRLAGVLAPRETVKEFLGGRIFYKPRIISVDRAHNDRPYQRMFWGTVLRGANPVIGGQLAGRLDEREFRGGLVAGPAAVLGHLTERVSTEEFHGKIEAGAVIGGILVARPDERLFRGELIALPPTLRGVLAARPDERDFRGLAMAFGPIRYRRPVAAVLGRDNRATAEVASGKASAKLGSTKA